CRLAIVFSCTMAVRVVSCKSINEYALWLAVSLITIAIAAKTVSAIITSSKVKPRRRCSAFKVLNLQQRQTKTIAAQVYRKALVGLVGKGQVERRVLIGG